MAKLQNATDQSTASSSIVTQPNTPYLTSLGTGAATSNTGTQNTSLGYQSMQNNTVGSDNCATGALALQNNVDGSQSTAVGSGALYQVGSGSNLIGIGYQAGSSYTTTEASNICIGNVGVNGESNAIHIGTQGTGAGQQNTCYIAGINGTSSITGNYPGVVLCDNTGALSTIPPAGASRQIFTTVTVGQLPSWQTMPNSLLGITDNDDPSTTALGYFALHANAGGQENTAIGYQSLQSNTTGAHNGALGVNSLYSNVTNSDNTAIGHYCLQNLNGGNQNTALGSNCLENLATGSKNVCLGYTNGNNYTGAETNNILIGTGILGVTGESNTIRIGDTDGITSCYVGGIAGVTTSNTNYVTINTTTGQLGSIVGDEIKLMFLVRQTSDVGNQTGDGTGYDIIYDTADVNVSSCYDTSTGIFTVPSTGVYSFQAGIVLSGLVVANTGINWLLINNTTGLSSAFYYSANETFTASEQLQMTGLTYLIPGSVTAGDTIKTQITVSGNATKNIDLYSNGGSNYIWWACYKVT